MNQEKEKEIYISKNKDNVSIEFSKSSVINLTNADEKPMNEKLINFINTFKLGKRCEDTKAEILLKRFRECNARNDRNIVPIAALEGFIDKFVCFTFTPQTSKKRTAPTPLTPIEQMKHYVTNIKSGKDYLCRNLNYSTCAYLVLQNMVSKEDCKKVGIYIPTSKN